VDIGGRCALLGCASIIWSAGGAFRLPPVKGAS
jgi:hypothetical protein